MKKSEAKVISYIHVGDGGKEDLEKYMSGTSNLTLQVISFIKEQIFVVPEPKTELN